MLLEMFIFFEVVALGIFVAAFFTKQEILWTIAAVILGVLMFTSFNIETYVYIFNESLGAYEPMLTTHSYPYLMGINLVFFALTLLLGLFDLFDKYGSEFAGRFRFGKIKP